MLPKRHHMDALTAREVETAKPTATRQEIPDGYTTGLYLIVQTSGASSWALRYSFQRKKYKLRLGGFPALSLADAREAANAAKALVDRGIDPRTEKAADTSAMTFEAAAADYVEKHVDPELRAGTAKYVQRELDAVTANGVAGCCARSQSATLSPGLMPSMKTACTRGTP